MIPDAGPRDDFNHAFALAIPARHPHRLPARPGVGQDLRQGREPFPFDPRSTELSGPSRGCWFVERRIETQAGDEADGGSQAATGSKQGEHSIGAVGHHDQQAVGQPAAHLRDQLASPVREPLVPEPSLLTGARFAGDRSEGASTVKNGSAQTRCAQGTQASSIRETQRSPPALLR